MKISEIKVREPFNQLFTIEDKVLHAIKENIEEHGYDPAFPIILWKDTVIDGHTRLKAAQMVGLEDIPVVKKSFKDELEALEYAVHNQRDRRNLSDAELLKLVEFVDKRKKHGGDRKSERFRNQGDTCPLDRSANLTAKILDTSDRKVKEARTVLDHADDELRKQIERGEKSIHKAAQEIREKKKIEKEATIPTFNLTNENIEWAKWTWNPITGCKHGCKYCYARDIANRFYPHKFEPHFYPERLDAPKDTKIPKSMQEMSGNRNVFVCSMGDLLGDWVPEEWINSVIDSMKKYPDWNYILLTKNPKRYLQFKWPEHCWLGTTTDIQIRAKKASKIFKQLREQQPNNILFFSCEPLMEEIQLSNNAPIDWLIIGGRSKSTGMAAGQPQWKWVEKLLWWTREHNIQVYFKPNLEVRPKEWPR